MSKFLDPNGVTYLWSKIETYVDENSGGVYIINVTDSGGTLVADKTFAEITQAVNDGKAAVVKNGTKFYQIRSIS